MKKSSGIILLSTALLGACASPPLHYYSLVPTETSPSAQHPARMALDILPVSLPAEVDRSEWIMRNQDGSIEILSSKRWAAPLGEELQAALAAQLVDETGMPLPDPASAPHLPILRVKLTIQRFDIAAGQPTNIAANWSLGLPNKPYLYCPLNFEAAAAPTDIAALANIRLWQKALAHQIGQAILAWSTTGSKPPTCPSLAH